MYTSRRKLELGRNPCLDNVDAQLERSGPAALSFRQMRKELGQLHMGLRSLRSANQRLHQLLDLHPGGSVGGPLHILKVGAI